MAEPWELGSQVEKPRQERGEGPVDLYSPDTDVVQQPLTPEQKVERFTAYWVEHAQERKRREREAARVAALEAQLAAPPSAPSAAPLPQPTDVVAAKQAKKKKKGGVISDARKWWERRRYRVKEKLKHPKEVQFVEAYLREHHEETETNYLITTGRSQKKVDKQRRKLEQRGYRVDGDQYGSDAVRYVRQKPMELSKDERKNLDDLLREVDKPIEAMRAMEVLGVPITGVTFYGATFQETTRPLMRAIVGRELEISRFFSKIRIRTEYRSSGGASTVQQILQALYDPEVSAVLSLSEEDQEQLVANMRFIEQYAGSEEKKQIKYPTLPAAIRYAQHREAADEMLHYTRAGQEEYEARRNDASGAAIEFDTLSRLRVVDSMQQLQQAGITLPRHFIERILPTRNIWERGEQDADAVAVRMQEQAMSLILDLSGVIENRPLMETARVVHEVTGRTVYIGSVNTEYGKWIGHAHELAGLLEAVLEAGFYVRSDFGRDFFEKSEPHTVVQYMDPGYIQFVKHVRQTLGIKAADLGACFMPWHSETADLYTLYAQPEIRTALGNSTVSELMPLIQPIDDHYNLLYSLKQVAELSHIPHIVETVRFFLLVSPEDKRAIGSFYYQRALLQRIGEHPSFPLLFEPESVAAVDGAAVSEGNVPGTTSEGVTLNLLEYASRGGSIAEFYNAEHAETVAAASVFLQEHSVSLYLSRDARECSGRLAVDAERFVSLQGLVGALGDGITADLDDVGRFETDEDGVRLGHQRITTECGCAHDGNTAALLAVAHDQSWEVNKGAVLQALEDTPSWKRNPEAISLLFQAFASSPTEMQAIMQLNRRVYGRGSEMSGWGVEQLRELIAFAPYHRQLERLVTLVGDSAFKMFSRLAPEHLTVLMELGDDVITRALQHVYIDYSFDVQMFIEFGTLIQRAGREHMDRVDRELGQWSIDCTKRALNEWRVLFNEDGLQNAVAQRRFEQRRNVRGYSGRWTVARTEAFARINSPEALAMIHTMEATPQDVYIFEYADVDVVLDLVAHPEHWEQMQEVERQYAWGLRSIINMVRQRPQFLAEVQQGTRAAAIHRAFRELYSSADRSPLVYAYNFDEWEALPVDPQVIPGVCRQTEFHGKKKKRCLHAT